MKNIKQSVRELEAYSVKSKPLSPDLIKLNQNENPFDLPAELKRELIEEFLQQPWNRYPDVFPTRLIEALSQFVGVPMESIIAANGSNELMYSVLMAIVSKGTKVLIPTPTFFLYEKIVKILEGELISVPAKPDLSFDVEQILATAAKEQPTLIILNSPNSPTGQMLTIENVERIIAGTDAFVLVDEAYIEFADMPSVLPLLKKYDRLIILRTFSKAFSLAGLRIGYLLAQPAVCAELLKPKIPFTVNNLSMAAAVRVMGEKKLISDRIRYIKAEKEKLYRKLSEMNEIKVFSSQTNFLIFRTKKNAKVLFDRLLSENVLIRDVSSYPMLENTLRVNAGTESENTVFLTAVQKHLK
ncbi:MAG: histidinol-phosphate transaminase [Bacteroidota bacterium]